MSKRDLTVLSNIVTSYAPQVCSIVTYSNPTSHRAQKVNMVRKFMNINKTWVISWFNNNSVNNQLTIISLFDVAPLFQFLSVDTQFSLEDTNTLTNNLINPKAIKTLQEKAWLSLCIFSLSTPGVCSAWCWLDGVNSLGICVSLPMLSAALP